MIASAEGNIIFLVVAAIIGVIKWLNKEQEPPKGNAPTPRSAPSSDEAERMRRFMEALGVPAGAPPPVPQRPTPPREPVRPPLPKASSVPPALPPKQARPQRPPKQPPVKPPAWEPTPTEGPVLPVSQLKIPELQTPAFAEFDTVSSHVTAIPFEASHSDMRDAYVTAADKPKTGSGPKVRELLSSPESVRTAILLREILGPPRAFSNEIR